MTKRWQKRTISWYLIKAMIKLTVFTGMIAIISTNAMAGRGDDLMVTGSMVNLRAEPSLNATILMRLSKGQQLIEISRYGEWVEVTARNQDVITGWIHESLLVAVIVNDLERNDSAESAGDSVKLFKERLAQLNTRISEDHGFNAFTGFEEVETGSIQITSTEEWMLASQTMREQILTSVFNLWSDAVEPGLSIQVTIVNPQGERHMMMFR